MSTTKATRLIAIVGGSGSGKSWLADRLQDVLGDRAGRLSLDHFYRDRSHLPAGRRARLNFDHPDAIEWSRFDEVLEAMAEGRPASVPQYDFSTHCRREDRPPELAGPIMLIDGLWLLHRARIRRRFDLSIFLECTEEERLRRRLVRDVAERGRDADSVRRQFAGSVAPMHERTVAPQMRRADLVLPQPCTEVDVRRLAAEILRRAAPAVRPASFTGSLSSVFALNPSLS